MTISDSDIVLISSLSVAASITSNARIIAFDPNRSAAAATVAYTVSQITGAGITEESASQAFAAIGHTHSLGGLSDFSITGSLSESMAIFWDGVNWVAGSLAGGGSGVLDLASLSDVSLSSPTTLQALVYNEVTGQWHNQSITAGAGEVSHFATVQADAGSIGATTAGAQLGIFGDGNITTSVSGSNIIIQAPVNIFNGVSTSGSVRTLLSLSGMAEATTGDYLAQASISNVARIHKVFGDGGTTISAVSVVALNIKGGGVITTSTSGNAIIVDAAATPVTAGAVSVCATGFSGILSATDTDGQTALDTIDAHSHTATTVTLGASEFLTANTSGTARAVSVGDLQSIAAIKTGNVFLNITGAITAISAQEWFQVPVPGMEFTHMRHRIKDGTFTFIVLLNGTTLSAFAGGQTIANTTGTTTAISAVAMTIGDVVTYTVSSPTASASGVGLTLRWMRQDFA